VGCVAIEDWSVSVLDLTRVVNDDDLSKETDTFTSWVVLGIRANKTSLELFN